MVNDLLLLSEVPEDISALKKILKVRVCLYRSESESDVPWIESIVPICVFILSGDRDQRKCSLSLRSPANIN